MTDWSALPRGYDFSHWNGTIDWDKVAETKPAFVGLKATEGVRVDPMFEANRRAAADRNLTWVPYPFLRADDDQSAIRTFLSVVSDPVPAALDWERAGVASEVVERWIDGMARQPLLYYGRWPPAPVTQKIASCPRWYPQYPGRPDAPPKLPPWDGKPTTNWSDKWLIWQWSDKGQVQGTSDGPDDLDRLACSVDVFRKWYETGVLESDAMRPAVPPLLVARVPLLRNMTGSDVGIVQRALVAHSFVVKLDNDLGPKTEAAVAAFQDQRHIVAVPRRGAVDAATLAALAV